MMSLFFPRREPAQSKTSQFNGPTPLQARPELYSAFSIVEDAKDKALKAAAKPQAGKIELYSPKYYAACTFGGMLACVRTHTHTHTHHGRSQGAAAGLFLASN
jgi:hypothetical protein